MCVTATCKRRRKQSKVGYRGTMHPMRRPRTKNVTVAAQERREQQRREKSVASSKKRK